MVWKLFGLTVMAWKVHTEENVNSCDFDVIMTHFLPLFVPKGNTGSGTDEGADFFSTYFVYSFYLRKKVPENTIKSILKLSHYVTKRNKNTRQGSKQTSKDTMRKYRLKYFGRNQKATLTVQHVSYGLETTKGSYDY